MRAFQEQASCADKWWYLYDTRCAAHSTLLFLELQHSRRFRVLCCGGGSHSDEDIASVAKILLRLYRRSARATLTPTAR